MSRTLVIIPTYNERDNLPTLVEAIRRTVARADILVVDDNSPDGTGQLADMLAKKTSRVHVVHRAAKEGLGRAYIAGFRWALAQEYDIICSMDADLSHPPEKLPDLIDAAETKADIAIGSRYVSGGKITGWTWDRYLLSWAANSATKLLLGLHTQDVTAGYKCYRRSFIESLDLSQIVSPGYAFQVEMLAQARSQDKKMVEIPITFHDRTVGRSKVSRHELVSSLNSLLTLAMRRTGLRQLGKFGLVGMLNFITDLVVTNVLVLAFDWHPIAAGYTGTALALGQSFYLNRHWTFQSYDRPIVHQFARFVLINGSGALLNALVYTLLIQVLGVWYNWAKLLAIFGSGLWNFIGTKYWVFSSRAGRANE